MTPTRLTVRLVLSAKTKTSVPFSGILRETALK
jgi:hypothetical protein